MVKLLWFGIRLTSGVIHARRYTGAHNVEDAKLEPSIEEWTDPYQAVDRNEATNIAYEKLKRL